MYVLMMEKNLIYMILWFNISKISYFVHLCIHSTIFVVRQTDFRALLYENVMLLAYELIRRT